VTGAEPADDIADGTERTLARIVSGLDYPMMVVTAHSQKGPAGCLVGFSTQCSIHPPRFLVCLSDKNRTEHMASHADVLAVHFLAEDALGLARAFGEQTTDDTDTFSRCRWHEGPRGAPILDACGQWFVGEILERRPLGDHVAYVLRPIAASDSGPGPGLTFQQVKDLDPGHLP
jgi:flavin reductase (DIM6/NTAB) family NADH-FMN oxidoreductase RutF